MTGFLMSALYTSPMAIIGGVVFTDLVGLRGAYWKVLIPILMVVTMGLGEVVLPTPPGGGGSPSTSKAGGAILVWFCWVIGPAVTRSVRKRKYG